MTSPQTIVNIVSGIAIAMSVYGIGRIAYDASHDLYTARDVCALHAVEHGAEPSDARRRCGLLLGTGQ